MSMLQYNVNTSNNKQHLFSIGTICKKKKNSLHWASRGRSVFLHQQVSAENMALTNVELHKLECLYIFFIIFHIPHEYQQHTNPLIYNKRVTVTFKHKSAFFLIHCSTVRFLLLEKAAHTVLHCPAL